MKYLVEETLKGESPKEFQIAFDVFGKRADSDKEKNIRIYIHNLRKKLADYYANEGANDEIQFEIPKGNYEVVFHIDKKAMVKSRIRLMAPYLFVAGFILFIFSGILFFQKKGPKATKHFIWKELHQSNFPTLIVLGDHYFFGSRNPVGGFGITRQTSINSDKDLENWIEEHPEIKDDIRKSTQTYINKQAPFGLYKIMTILGGGQTSIDLQYSSTFMWEHVANKNVVFIGSYKTQNILQQVHKKLGIEYLINQTILNYTVNDSTISYDTRTEGFLTIEYASFCYFKTSEGRCYMSFMCNSDVGNMAVLKFLSKPENLKMMEEKTLNFEGDNFKAVFEVKGQRDTDFQIKLARIDEIKANIEEIWP
ncbi:hypothetical protein EMN47_09200 [Prolixibacteraceae bacterium JC049]|nr:hypothetical protein [Prolixibacteraceae bacterium JC049]